jgi:hypothetical protein
MRLKKGSSMISSRKQEARMSKLNMIYKCIMLGYVFFTTKNTNRVQSSQLRIDETAEHNPINLINPINHSSDSKKRLTGFPDAFLGFPDVFLDFPANFAGKSKNLLGTPENIPGTPENFSCREENFKRVINF